MEYKINLPISDVDIEKVRIGDKLLLSGIIYTARDAAHKRIVKALGNGDSAPFKIENSAIYYVGPTPTPPGKVIGSAGPTTSYRIDNFTPFLLDRGLKIMIGKGQRSKEVIEAIKRNKALYLVGIGGAGVVMSRSIKSSEIIAYENLGAEAVRRLEVKDFPCIVAVDSLGNDIYKKNNLHK